MSRDFEKSKGKTDLRKADRNWRKSKSKVRIMEKLRRKVQHEKGNKIEA